MDLVARVQAIALKPKEEWAKIKAETTTVQELFTSCAMILAAIPAVAQFIGYGLIGRRYPFIGLVRMGLGTSLVRAILLYIFSLVTVYVFALIIGLNISGAVWRELRIAGWVGVLLIFSAGWTNFGYVQAIIEGEVMRVLLLFYLAPLWTIFFAHFLLGERLNRYGFAGTPHVIQRAELYHKS